MLLLRCKRSNISILNGVSVTAAQSLRRNRRSSIRSLKEVDKKSFLGKDCLETEAIQGRSDLKTLLPVRSFQPDDESQRKHGSGIVSGTHQQVQGVDLASEVVQTSSQLSICGMYWTNRARLHRLLGFNDLLLTTLCQISQHRFRDLLEPVSGWVRVL